MKTKHVKLPSGQIVEIRRRAGILGIRRMLRARPAWLAARAGKGALDIESLTTDERDELLDFQVSQVCAYSVRPKYVADEHTTGDDVSIDTLDDDDFFALVTEIQRLDAEGEEAVSPLSATASS